MNVLLFKRNVKKGSSITWFESNDESEEETTKKIMAFTRKYESEEDYSDEEMTGEELTARFRLLHNKWEEACLNGEK